MVTIKALLKRVSTEEPESLRAVAAFAGGNSSESAAGFVADPTAETAASSAFLVGIVTEKYDIIVKL